MAILDVYDLEEWVATDCAGVGDSKALAQQHAAQQLIQGGRYCVSAKVEPLRMLLTFIGLFQMLPMRR